MKIKELEIVRRLTNVDDENRIELNETGWTSRVYIVDNGRIVFKFPKSKKYREELEHEINILKLINKQRFNLNIPLLHWVGEDNAYTGFYGMQGKSITPEIICKLSDKQKRKAGVQIGLFLKTLHAIDYKGKSPNNESNLFEWFEKSFCQRKRTLSKYFSKNELDTMAELVKSLPTKSANLGLEYVFCHGDLGYNNLVLNDDMEVGVIDFGDAGNHDKSYDFIGLEDDVLLHAAIAAYGGDDVLREKVAIRRPLLPLMEMLFLIDRKDKEGLEKCAEKMRINLKKNIL
jgi:thiamine kinase-like enzyme